MLRKILVVMLLLSLAGCGSNNSMTTVKQQDETTTQTLHSAKQTKDLAVKQDKWAKLPEDNMYQEIKVGGSSLRIPAAWKDNWDYIMNNCEPKLCKVFDQLGWQYVMYCEQEVKRKCKNQPKQKVENISQQTKSQDKKVENLTWQVVQPTYNKDCSKVKKYEDKLACYMSKVFDKNNKNKSCKEIIPANEKKILYECVKAKVIDAMIQKNDVKICDKLRSNKQAYQECKNVYYDKNAFDKKDVKLCEKITDAKMKEACKQRLQENK